MKRQSAVSRFVDLEAQVETGEEEEEWDGLEALELANFLDYDEEHESEGESISDGSSDLGRGTILAPVDYEDDVDEEVRRLKRLAAGDRRLRSVTVEEGQRNNDWLAEKLAKIGQSERHNLYCFKVQSHRFEVVAQHFSSLCADPATTVWLEDVFTVPHLLNRIFVVASPDTIDLVMKKCRLTIPTIVPRNEWNQIDSHSSFLGNSEFMLKPQSWMRIMVSPYRGNTGYVVASAKHVEYVLILVVPSEISALEPPKKRGKSRHQEKTSLRPRRFRLFDPNSVPHDTRIDSFSPSKPSWLTEIFLEHPSLLDRPNAVEVEVADLPLTFLDGERAPVERVYLFQRAKFFKGLLFVYAHISTLQPISDVPIAEMAYFVESTIDPPRNNRVFDRMHWRIGDRLESVSSPGFPYIVADIQLEDKTVTVVNNTDGIQQTEQMSMFRRYWRVGDEVRITAGPHKGQSGHIVNVNSSIGTVLTSSDEKGFTEVNECLEWMESYSSPFKMANAYNISLGDRVRVIAGHEIGRTGVVVDLHEEGKSLFVCDDCSLVHSSANEKFHVWTRDVVRSNSAQNPLKDKIFVEDHNPVLKVGDNVRLSNSEEWTGLQGRIVSILSGGGLRVSVYDREEETSTELFLSTTQCTFVGRFNVHDIVVVHIDNGIAARTAIVLQADDANTLTVELLDHSRRSVIVDRDKVEGIEDNSSDVKGGKHCAIGKWVIVSHFASLKGQKGFVESYNSVTRLLLVAIHEHKYNLSPCDLIYEDDGQNVALVERGIEPLSAEKSSLSSQSLAPRFPTPIPEEGDGPLWGATPEDSVDDWASTPPPVLPSSFLADSIWKNLGDRHVRLRFNQKFQNGSLLGRLATTKFPLDFVGTHPPSKVTAFWTDMKSIRRDGEIDLACVTPAPPMKKGTEVMVISGDRRGQILQVTKINKAAQSFESFDSQKVKVQEHFDNVCVVEKHNSPKCCP